MSLSADLKAIHEAGEKYLTVGGETYLSMAAETSGLADQHQAIMATAAHSAQLDGARQGQTFDYWTDALAALRLTLTMAGNNMHTAGDILRMIAYAYARTDEEAATDLKRAEGLDDIPDYVDSGWR